MLEKRVRVCEREGSCLSLYRRVIFKLTPPSLFLITALPLPLAQEAHLAKSPASTACWLRERAERAIALRGSGTGARNMEKREAGGITGTCSGSDMWRPGPLQALVEVFLWNTSEERERKWARERKWRSNGLKEIDRSGLTENETDVKQWYR